MSSITGLLEVEMPTLKEFLSLFEQNLSLESVVQRAISFLSSTERKGLVQFCMVTQTGIPFFCLFVYRFYLATCTVIMRVPSPHCSSLTMTIVCVHVFVCTCK